MRAGTSPTKDRILLSQQFQPRPEPVSMIMIMDPGCNPVSQEIYDFNIRSIELLQMICTCNRTGTFIKYGKYARHLRFGDKAEEIRIQRVVCRECGRTHALLPSSIVPYAQIPLREQVFIIGHYGNQSDMEQFYVENEAIDENSIKSVSMRYRKYWLQRILSESIPLTPLDDLVRECFLAFSRQFMQIRKGLIKLFLRPT
jgi:hypothetical protein